MGSITKPPVRSQLFSLIIGCLLATPFCCAAVTISSLEMVGTFGKKAILKIDGKRRIVPVGKSSPEGVRLLSLQGESATIEWNGEQKVITVGQGNRFKTSYKASKTSTVSIARDGAGMYRTSVSINGVSLPALIDTGASTVAMNLFHAKKLGINYFKGKKVLVNTASGQTQGYQVQLDRVRLGKVELRNIGGIVLPGAEPSRVLVGMTFLSRLKMEDAGTMLKLTKQH